MAVQDRPIPKLPWWQTTTSPRLAAFLGAGWMIVALGELAWGITAGRVWVLVLGSLFLLCGAPWYITAAVLVRRRHRRDPRP